MQLLYDHDLIYGRLLDISQPFLVERYRKAMIGIGLPPTKLDQFKIDMTGFSPQIAEELGNDHYLDPNGVNRHFIILTPEQEHLPVVHTQFSNTAWLMHRFFKDNARSLHAITIKDVVYGEIDDPVTDVHDIEDLLSIEKLSFNVKSADALLEKANELRAHCDELLRSDTAWRDDELLSKMVDLAAQTGDIRQNSLVPEHLVFEQNSYWANHFGGVFIFKDRKTVTVICDKNAPGFRKSRPWQVSYIDIHDHRRIFEFLYKTKRLQMPHRTWVKSSKLYQHRAEMAVFDVMHQQGEDMAEASSDSLKNWVRAHSHLFGDDSHYSFFKYAYEEIIDDERVEIKDVGYQNFLMLVRAWPEHQEAWLINRLLSRLNPFDFVSRYIFDKQGFYEAYRNYTPEFKQHVVSTLKNTYLIDKPALRARLYGTKGHIANA